MAEPRRVEVPSYPCAVCHRASTGFAFRAPGAQGSGVLLLDALFGDMDGCPPQGD